MLPQRESLPAVTAAGIVAILFSSLGILFGVLMQAFLLALPNLESGSKRTAMPPETRAAASVVWFFILIVAIGGLVVAINVLRRRNWARIMILVWGGTMAVLSAISCIAVFFILSVMPQSVPDVKDAASFLIFMKFFLVIFYAIPCAVGVWWLILFTRPRVVAAFKTRGTTLPAPMPFDASGFPQPQPPPALALSSKPSCPVPLLIVAGLLLSSAVSTPLIMFLPTTPSVPFFFFGITLYGSTGKIVLAALSLLYGIAGIGLIKLKPAALNFILIFQVIFLINGIASLASPNYLNEMHEAVLKSVASNPALPPDFPFFTGSFFKGMLIFGLFFSLAMVGVLVAFRERFLKAAAEAAR
jgi:hypothetical protein